jgi:DNA-binding transcriptional MocR family regulator
MCDLFDDLSPEIDYTTSEGGMFMMATLPRGIMSRAVYDAGIRQNVAVLPGMPFNVDGGGGRILSVSTSQIQMIVISKREGGGLPRSSAGVIFFFKITLFPAY